LNQPDEDVIGNRAMQYAYAKPSVMKIRNYLEKLMSNRRKVGE